MRLHGNPGTAEGRRLGGLRSVASQNKKPTGFVLLRRIHSPYESTELAELCGIVAGDGHIGEYQISVCTNSKTDMMHAIHTKKLFKQLFKIPVTLTKRKGQNACVVVVSSKEVGNFLVSRGMCRGHKIRGGISMPKWVKNKNGYRLAFTRGLFDTDGCIYIDKHIVKGYEYKNLGMAFTNRSLPLLSDFKETLESIGLHPTQKTKYTVFLRREKDIKTYFEVIGSSNPKHAQKVRKNFSLKKGGVG